jgi:hypothetical protein
MAAVAPFTHRVGMRVADQSLHSVWGALNWLHLWEGNISHEPHNEFEAKDQQHIAPHL